MINFFAISFGLIGIYHVGKWLDKVICEHIGKSLEDKFADKWWTNHNREWDNKSIQTLENKVRSLEDKKK